MRPPKRHPAPCPLARSIRIVAVTLPMLLVFAAPALCQIRRSEAIRERIQTRPDDPTLYYYLAIAEFAEGDRAAGLEALEQVARIGHGFLPVRDMGFDGVWDDPAFQKVRARLESRLPRVTAARALFRLERRLIPEGIAWDPASRSYFVGSIAASKIVRVDSAGTVSDLSRPGELGHVLGLVVDPRRRRLHAVSTNLIEGATDTTRNRVVSYDLETGGRVRTFVVPSAVQLNDVTVAASGELYATDSRAGAVFRIRPESGDVDAIVAPGTLPGVNGLALSGDGTALYLGHATGVSRYVLATGELLPRIPVPKGEAIGGIDGLYVDGNTLIGIQNVTNPGRVIRVHLGSDGAIAHRVETLLSHHHPDVDEPTTGVIVGRAFVLLATTQVARFTPAGTITSPETLKRPVVLTIPLDGR
jgi:sugar lactone lactonase YvrE